jgi:hydroxymethylglutaryl-CoA lyase
MSELVTITECPRDAFQGLAKFIPTDEKIAYMNALTAAGARRIDFGSFVSPKAVPQMADTVGVFENMKKPDGTYLIAIVGNRRGLGGLVLTNGKFARSGRIQAAGYPLSVSETFQQRNLGRGIEESLEEFAGMVTAADTADVAIICYLSMAFGNPYGDLHSVGLVVDFARRVSALGVKTISLADTIGAATPELTRELFRACMTACPGVTFTAHFHARAGAFGPVVDAALDEGCRLFDSALAGIGGCPFAKDELTGNLDTLELIAHLEKRGLASSLDAGRLRGVAALASRYATTYGG